MSLENKIKKLELLALTKATKKQLKSQKPVYPKKFVEGEHFMNAKGVLYSVVMKEFQKLNSGKYTEAICTGAIGVGKTTIALYTIAYQLYLLSCMKDPHAKFKLDPASEIVILFQSINAKLAKNVDFKNFRKLIKGSPYFQNNFRPLSMSSSEICFPNGIVVRTGSGLATTALGQNIFACLIDEVNFMAVNSQSLKSEDGGVYDQAKAIHNSISTRRKSRFMRGGKLYGMICISSSRRYPDEFTDRLERQARAELLSTGKTSTFIFDKRLWDVKPEEFGLKRFNTNSQKESLMRPVAHSD